MKKNGRHRWHVVVAALCGLAAAPGALAAADFLFSWRASTDPGVRAYGIYQRTDDSAYERVDEVDVADLDDPANPAYTVTGLADGSTYRFAASAISGTGGESDLYGQTCIVVNGQVVACDDDDGDATVVVSCFIGAAGALGP
jgi:hypothetical protein